MQLLIKKTYTKPAIVELSVELDTNGQAKGTASNEGQPGGMVVGMMLTAS